MALPADVIHCILPHVQSRRDLESASLVNREFANISRRYVFRQISIWIHNGTERFRGVLEFLRSRPDVCSYVQELVVTGIKAPFLQLVLNQHQGEGLEVISHIDALENALKEGLFTNLKKLEWDIEETITTTFANTVHNAFPRCDWVISTYSGNPLPPLPNLISLSSVTYYNVEALLYYQPILLRAPRLRTLDVVSFRPRGSSFPTHGAPPFMEHDPNLAVSREAYPAIEELTMRWLLWSLEGARQCLQMMRCSQLRCLKLMHGNSSPFLQGCIPTRQTLPALREFKLVEPHLLNPETFRDALKQFLATMASGLHDLQIEASWQTLVPTIAEHHGETLRSLVLHESERGRAPQRSTLKLADLIALGNTCVSLRHLGVDVEADYSVPGPGIPGGESFAAVVNSPAYFPSLRQITLWAPLGLMDIANVLESQGNTLDGEDPLYVLEEHAYKILDPSLCDTDNTEQRDRGKLESLTVNLGEQEREFGARYPDRESVLPVDSFIQLT
ncbi:uncharacterized protein C8Q71DRAFT_444213 [Rhodofomes roseus]|uniref:F-box domain-containing protein n=1 Tax=Rhodofomes roseus TaxID=34475 RepID=A0ABQ8JYB4_9APHY|nr:uncharacterized protein C8Q71DRAFT_444213 [Rhodofomes roseus]KAH9829250.1 hypothetical protein C8Q71DRAFT_444213 [Rhodofomes roseus]